MYVAGHSSPGHDHLQLGLAPPASEAAQSLFVPPLAPVQTGCYSHMPESDPRQSLPANFFFFYILKGFDILVNKSVILCRQAVLFI